jgi:hypothetical protein
MSALQEIAKWSVGLPAWLSDAGRRAIEKGTLCDQDFDDLTGILMESVGIPDPLGRKAVRLDPTIIPLESPSGGKISLKSIRKPINVNALEHPDGVTFETDGLTILFGQNGAGKSGYVRVLKNACRSRDQENIICNVFKPPSKEGPACATLEWKSNDADKDADWVDGHLTHDELSDIAVFDSRCARLFVDDEQEVHIVPYGVDVLREMVRTCGEVKARLDAEIKAASFDLSIFAPLHGETMAGKFVKALGPKSDKEEARRLATLSDDEKAEREALAKQLADDPIKKATELRRLSMRILTLETELSATLAPLSDDAIGKLRTALATYKVADDASKLAANELDEGGKALKGTGSDPWRELVSSAITFAQQGPYPGQQFPAEEVGVRCVLCQQSLETVAKDRLRRFAKFLEADTQKKATARRKEAADLYAPISNVNPTSVPLDKTILEEIAEHDPSVPIRIKAFINALDSRRTNVITMAKAREITDCAALPEDPSASIKCLRENLNSQVVQLEKASKNEERVKLCSRLSELNIRTKLAEMFPLVEKAIDCIILQTKLAECVKQTITTGITRKTTEMTEAALAKGLNDALTSELKAFNLASIKVGIDLRGQKGTGLQQLKLDLPKPIGKVKLSDILSEGEQRAIAIGCFLAEISLLPGQSGIVFDDPVSSLDNYRRELFAKRLSQEALKRQVIIFTHELSFAWDLMEAAAKVGAKCKASRIYAAGANKGITAEGLPFEAGKLSARISSLVDQAIRAKKILENEKNVEEYERLVHDGYRKLRDTWERLIEEGLFGEAVRRFRNSIQTKRLKYAYVDDQDFQEIWEGMTRCSNYTHDAPLEAPPSTPTPDDFIRDVERLKTNHDRIVKRNKLIEERRIALVPQAK